MACTHKWQLDNKNVGTCSVCGEVKQFPLSKGEKPVVLKEGKTRNAKMRRPITSTYPKYQRHRYFEDNKEAITLDLLSIGRMATRAKWGILSPSLVNLERRWLTDDERARIPVPLTQGDPAAGHGAAGSQNGRLPAEGLILTLPELKAALDLCCKETLRNIYHGATDLTMTSLLQKITAALMARTAIDTDSRHI